MPSPVLPITAAWLVAVFGAAPVFGNCCHLGHCNARPGRQGGRAGRCGGFSLFPCYVYQKAADGARGALKGHRPMPPVGCFQGSVAGRSLPRAPTPHSCTPQLCPRAARDGDSATPVTCGLLRDKVEFVIISRRSERGGAAASQARTFPNAAWRCWGERIAHLRGDDQSTRSSSVFLLLRRAGDRRSEIASVCTMINSRSSSERPSVADCRRAKRRSRDEAAVCSPKPRRSDGEVASAFAILTRLARSGSRSPET